MDGLYCIMVGENQTLTDPDEFGNAIAYYFTTKAAVDRFCAAGRLPDDARIVAMPLSAAVHVIVGHIKSGVAFFSLNPRTRDSFRTLSTEEFLLALLGSEWRDGVILGAGNPELASDARAEEAKLWTNA